MTHQWTLKPHSEWKCFGRLVGWFAAFWWVRRYLISKFPPYAAVHVVGTSTLTTARLTNKSPAVDTWTTRHDSSSGSGSFTDHRNISDERHLKGDHLLDMKTSSEKWGIWYSLYIAAVVGGFNPSEKYSSNRKSSLNRGENKKYMSNHHPNSVQTLQKNTTKFWNHPMMCFDRNLRGLAPNPSLPPASAKKHQEKWKTSNPEIGFKIPTFKHFRPDIPWSPKSCNVHGASKQRIWRVLRGWIRHGETKLDGYSLWNGQLVGGFSPTDLKNMTKSNCIISPQNGLKINKKFFNPPSQDCFFLFLSN